MKQKICVHIAIFISLTLILFISFSLCDYILFALSNDRSIVMTPIQHLKLSLFVSISGTCLIICANHIKT